MGVRTETPGFSDSLVVPCSSSNRHGSQHSLPGNETRTSFGLLTYTRVPNRPPTLRRGGGTETVGWGLEGWHYTDTPLSVDEVKVGETET